MKTKDFPSILAARKIALNSLWYYREMMEIPDDSQAETQELRQTIDDLQRKLSEAEETINDLCWKEDARRASGY